MELFERLMSEAFDDGVVSEVIRPAAIVPEAAARLVLVEMSLRDVRAGGNWHAEPTLWRFYDRPCEGEEEFPPDTHLIGSLQVAYGTPTRYDITVYRVTITTRGVDQGWTVESLCDEALGYGGLSLADCPRAALLAAPPPFQRRTHTES